jgi:hypothetical protein
MINITNNRCFESFSHYSTLNLQEVYISCPHHALYCFYINIHNNYFYKAKQLSSYTNFKLPTSNYNYTMSPHNSNNFVFACVKLSNSPVRTF